MPDATTIRNGRYELVEVAGRGGMAIVWRATQKGDVGFERTVAVKQMHDHLSESQLYIDMFAEEARVGAEITGPNLVQVFDFVQEKSQYYLVLEWVEGIDLGSMIRYFSEHGGQMPWEMCAAIGVGVLRALADAHERVGSDGIVSPILHRDVSPHNVLINTRGIVKLIDFGLCLARDRTKELTEPGVVKGKMSYLSPEIVTGKRPTVKSDQFAVGSVLWEMLAGAKLFDGENDFDVYKKIREGQVAPIRPIRKDLPRPLIQILNRALATDPGQRFPSTREMGRELGAILKSARAASKDLHDLIGRTVLDAREHLKMGGRTGEHSSATPLAEPTIDLVTLPGEEESGLSRPRMARPTAPVVVADMDGDSDTDTDTAEKRGLLHRFPFFGRKK